VWVVCVSLCDGHFLAGEQYRFCRDNFLSAPTLAMIVDMKLQVQSELVARGFVHQARLWHCNRHNDRVNIVLACITAGLFPHAAQRLGRTCTEFHYSPFPACVCECVDRVLYVTPLTAQSTNCCPC
jgi:hypothetical protein